MRWFLLLVAAVLMAGGTYLASPFVTAWYIREAIKTGNSAYLAEKVEFASVKETLKPTVSRMVFDLPEAPAEGAKPSLWQRTKAYFGQGAVDRMLDSYMTPEGLPQLFQYGKTYRERVKGQVEEPAGMPLHERAWRVWQRVKRADFVTLTRFEMTMADKFEPDRLIDGVLEFKGYTWKLTELRIRSEGPNSQRSQVNGQLRLSNLWGAAQALAAPR